MGGGQGRPLGGGDVSGERLNDQEPDVEISRRKLLGPAEALVGNKVGRDEVPKGHGS